MEGLKELVAASFARHGIVCPADSQSAWGRTPVPILVGKAALGCPERSSASASSHSNSGSATTQTSSPVAPALPEHNFRKSSQDSCG
jgi:hypothetical protein